MKQLLAIGLCVAAIGAARAGLYEDFQNPPEEIKVGCYYYWVNERVDPVGCSMRTFSPGKRTGESG